MNITIAFGWWLIPVSITGYAFWRSVRYSIKRGQDIDAEVILPARRLAHGAALVVTLFAWLLYAVVRLCLTHS